MKDITGKRFGRLIVQTHSRTLCYMRNSRRQYRTYWLCACDCGANKEILGNSLTRGLTQSCGCLQKERCIEASRTHGMSRTDTYNIWQKMLKRCNDPSCSGFCRYGGRGITVCPRWFMFENFLEDMGVRPSKNHSIDLIDNNGNYEAANCRWATAVQQANNRRTNSPLTVNGITLNISQWAERLGVLDKTLYERLAKGWAAERIILQPIRGHSQCR